MVTGKQKWKNRVKYSKELVNSLECSFTIFLFATFLREYGHSEALPVGILQLLQSSRCGPSGCGHCLEMRHMESPKEQLELIGVDARIFSSTMTALE